MRNVILLSLVLISGLVMSAETKAQTNQPMMDKGRSGVPLGSPFDRAMCAMDGVATGGFDLISYRQPDGPVLGTTQFSEQYEGATYLFASQSNLDTFRADAIERRADRTTQTCDNGDWSQVDTLMWLGRAHDKKGDQARAEQYYRRALARSPDNHWIKAALAGEGYEWKQEQ